jgi:hypothetical protein
LARGLISLVRASLRGSRRVRRRHCVCCRVAACHRAGMVIGNKADLRESGRGVVDEKEGRALAQSLQLAYFETSAVRGVASCVALSRALRIHGRFVTAAAAERCLPQELNVGIDTAFQHLAGEVNREYEAFQSRMSSGAY